MDHVLPLIRRCFPSSGRELCLDGVNASELATQYGTPLFVYCRDVMEKSWTRLRKALPPQFSIYYSVKANPSQTVIREFLSKGAGLEVASAGEFSQALRAGCKPENTIFAGPGKTNSELEFVVARGIGEIHVESMREAERLSKIAGNLGRCVPIALRVNPSGEAEGGAMRMGGRPAAFGIDEEDLEQALDLVASLNHLEFRGIHLFSGTQILDYRILASQYRKGIEIALQAATHLKKSIHTLDFGGGLGIPYFSHEPELDMERVADELHALFKSLQGETLFSHTRFLVEPGRYLVGEAGVYVSRVVDLKTSRGKNFVILDGGMNHHLAASGNLGQTIKRNYPIAAANKLGQPAETTYEVVGPLCTPLDVLARSVVLPSLEIGDLVAIFQSGAYARSASPLGFLSHPTPPEVWVDGAQHRLIRRRGELADYFCDQLADIEPTFSNQ
jgi:diaminopimelate decarboxylase